MIKNYVKYVNCRMIFCLLLVLLVINSSGCSLIKSEARQNQQSQTSGKQGEGSILVTKYMAHISKWEIQEADKFLAPAPAPEVKYNSDLVTGDGPSPPMPWSSMLSERNLVLTKIINEKSEGETAQVSALLEVDKAPDINISAKFYLKKINGNLLITDIELTPGKTNM